MIDFTISELQHKVKTYFSDFCGLWNTEIRTVNLYLFNELSQEIIRILHVNFIMTNTNISLINGYYCCYWATLIGIAINLLPFFFLWIVFLSCKFNLRESPETSLMSVFPNGTGGSQLHATHNTRECLPTQLLTVEPQSLIPDALFPRQSWVLFSND